MIETFEHGTYLLGHHVGEIISDDRAEEAFEGTLVDITDLDGSSVRSARSLYIGEDGAVVSHVTRRGRNRIYFLVTDNSGIVIEYIHPTFGDIHIDGDHLIYTSKTHKYVFAVKN